VEGFRENADKAGDAAHYVAPHFKTNFFIKILRTIKKMKVPL
jgi:hypothetical protein